ncbi:MAG: hypothetical protein WCK76_04815 [Elusimicrobiota bacterium]
MKKIIFRNLGAAAAAALLAGCDEIKFSGAMDVAEQLTVVQRVNGAPCNPHDPWDTDCGPQDEKVALKPGKFPAAAELGASGGKKRISLELENDGGPKTVQLEFDDDIEIGETFSVSAAQLKQEFGIEGAMATKVERSEERSRYEGCYYQYPQTVCRAPAETAAGKAAAAALAAGAAQFQAPPAAEPPAASDPAPAGGRHDPHHGSFGQPYHPSGCYTQWFSRPGNRYVRYYEETTLRDINADFVKAGRKAANYKGHSSQTRNVYTYQGECR